MRCIIGSERKTQAIDLIDLFLRIDSGKARHLSMNTFFSKGICFIKGLSFLWFSLHLAPLPLYCINA
jgi:hypothetical protein